MNKIRLIVLAAVLAAPAAMAADVGVSVTLGQPGFFGRIDLGNVPQPPQVVLAQPVIIQQPYQGVAAAPIYLRVPPEHQRHWRRYCGRYNACGVPVYFVQDAWYQNVYVPHYSEWHGGERHEEHRDDRREGERHDNGRHEGERRDGDHHDGDRRDGDRRDGDRH